jgi:hypothetical protein
MSNPSIFSCFILKLVQLRHALRSLGNSLEGADHISATINDRGSS